MDDNERLKDEFFLNIVIAFFLIVSWGITNNEGTSIAENGNVMIDYHIYVKTALVFYLPLGFESIKYLMSCRKETVIIEPLSFILDIIIFAINLFFLYLICTDKLLLINDKTKFIWDIILLFYPIKYAVFALLGGYAIWKDSDKDYKYISVIKRKKDKKEEA